MIGCIYEWIDVQARRQTPIYEFAMDNRVYVAVVALAVITGILSGFYG